MKILIVSGSPRKGGNTDIMAQAFAQGAQSREEIRKGSD